MSQRGGFRGGGRKGRDRSSPYNTWKDRPGRNWGGKKAEGDGPKQAKGVSEEVRTPEKGPGGAAGASLLATPDAVDGTSVKPVEKKFSNKARLFVGNLPRDFTEEQLRKLFAEHGEVQEVYVHKEKSFGFVRMAYRIDAEKAISALNGLIINKRDIKVRYAASSTSVKVSNLNPLVSNELLAEAFSQFGEVESAVVVSDDRGKSLGYGVVDFARKNQAMSAIQHCKNDHFLLTRSAVPVLVAEMDKGNDQDGVPERGLARNQNYHYEREVPPRFAQPSGLDFEVASRWKAHYEFERQQKEDLEQRLKEARNQLQQDLKGIADQHQTVLIRQEIARHQQEQLRLAEQLRQQEERLGMLGQPMAPLFAPGTGPGEGVDHVPQDPSLLGPGSGLAGYHHSLQSAPSGAFYPPPPLMGQFR